MIDQLKGFVADCRQVGAEFSSLKANLHELSSSINDINDFAAGVTASVEEWQFKNKPRLARIHKLLLNLDIKN